MELKDDYFLSAEKLKAKYLLFSQRGRVHWTLNYTCTQSFINTLSHLLRLHWLKTVDTFIKFWIDCSKLVKSKYFNLSNSLSLSFRMYINVSAIVLSLKILEFYTGDIFLNGE